MTEPQTSPAVENAPGPSGKPSVALPVPVIAGAAFGLLLLAAVFWAANRPPAPAPPPLTDEARAYLPSVTVSDLRMSVADNMIGSKILYLDGVVANSGDRTVRLLRVRLYFYDTMSQVILRVERNVVTPEGPPLGPGESRQFQLRLDRPPASWSVQLPQFQLVSLQIE